MATTNFCFAGFKTVHYAVIKKWNGNMFCNLFVLVKVGLVTGNPALFSLKV